MIRIDATSGLKSIMPFCGKIARMGSRIGSVRIYNKRIIGLVYGSSRTQDANILSKRIVA